jgi:hypothetical protein
MLTDSSSFCHFRDTAGFPEFCVILLDEIKRGELPHDAEWIGKMVSEY